VRLEIIATLLALVGSIWTLNIENCNKCYKPPGTKLPLSKIGVGYYIFLLYGLLKNKPWVKNGLKVSAIVHVALIAHMLYKQNVCFACLATGISAITAASVAD